MKVNKKINIFNIINLIKKTLERITPQTKEIIKNFTNIKDLKKHSYNVTRWYFQFHKEHFIFKHFYLKVSKSQSLC